MGNQQFNDQQFRVGILTGYLTGVINNETNSDRRRVQIEKYGACDIRDILQGFQESEKGIYSRVCNRESNDESSLKIIIDLNHEGAYKDVLHNADLVITGCTLENERDVSVTKNIGILVARCSIFYGRPSDYSNRLPKKAGYAFDVPKDKEKVFSFITDKTIATAILERNIENVKRGVAELNNRLEYSQPILITSHLDTAMEISRIEQKKRIEELIECDAWQSNIKY